jgi:predicted RNA-binding Zn ribbon-like protein
MVGANRGGSVDAAALAKLDRAVFAVALRVRFDAGGATRYEPTGDGFEGALGRLVQLVASARAEGLWRRLKLCADPDCRRAFFDGSQNRAGKWCSMSRCGGRFKSRAFRRRHPGHRQG